MAGRHAGGGRHTAMINADEELAVVRRRLEEMTGVITRHSHGEPPPS